jgi:hypothetical protein
MIHYEALFAELTEDDSDRTARMEASASATDDARPADQSSVAGVQRNASHEA